MESSLERDVNIEREFWNEYLRGAPEVLQLPTDGPRIPLQLHPVGYFGLKINDEVTRRLRLVVQQQGATLRSALLGALAILLCRWSGQQDVVIGAALVDRRRQELASAGDLFQNARPVRVQLNDDSTVEQLLEQVEEASARIRDNNPLPYQDIRDAGQPGRIQGRHSVFQVVLVLDDTREPALPLPRESHPAYELSPRSVAQSELSFQLSAEDGDGICGLLGYATDLFSRERIERLVGHWKVLLKELAGNPRRSIGELSMLTDYEREQVLRAFNSTAVVFGADELIHEVLEKQAGGSPGVSAVEYEDQRLTYFELNSKANQLARRLRALGVGPDHLVGVFLDRRVEMFVAIFGILKAGGAYVPLDPTHPRDRIAYILEDAAPQVILTVEAFRQSLPPTEGTCVFLDSQWHEISEHENTNLDPRMTGLASCHLAYVIYTSGSTGKPNGVMVEHRNVVNHWHVVTRLYQDPFKCQRIALNAPFTFDVSVQQFVLLLSGCTVVIVPESARRDSQRLFSFLALYQVEGLDCTPSQLNTWIVAGLLDGGGYGVRTIIVGGEAIDTLLWTRLTQYSQIAFYNVYGPTECTVFSTAAYLCGARPEPHIGHPTSNAYVFILDSKLRPAPIGVTGEIFIGGAGVARGYLNRPELTRERFIADPFSRDLSARLYRTGDLGRWRPDGSIEFLGRTDHQVKVRGFRIEEGEIEIQLLRHPQVSESVVVAREDVPGDRRLVAYLRTRKGPAESGPSQEELRKHLESMLPEYMIPSAFVILNTFPLTANGKLDRRALPAPEFHTYASQHCELPKGEMEEALAGIWRDVLRVEKIGRQHKFLELGGHSVQGMRLVERIAKHFGIQMCFPDIFQFPTVRQMAELVEMRQAQKDTGANPQALACAISHPPLSNCRGISATIGDENA